MLLASDPRRAAKPEGSCDPSRSSRCIRRLPGKSDASVSTRILFLVANRTYVLIPFNEHWESSKVKANVKSRQDGERLCQQ